MSESSGSDAAWSFPPGMLKNPRLSKVIAARATCFTFACSRGPRLCRLCLLIPLNFDALRKLSASLWICLPCPDCSDWNTQFAASLSSTSPETAWSSKIGKHPGKSGAQELSQSGGPAHRGKGKLASEGGFTSSDTPLGSKASILSRCSCTCVTKAFAMPSATGSKLAGCSRCGSLLGRGGAVFRPGGCKSSRSPWIIADIF
mmetsp:Transcript_57319/g.134102  ORF Transcript_57319/g.134102 Transcript_57319/m.134102 type:complete len:202 (-) Transcript_57319:15-620(-)